MSLRMSENVEVWVNGIPEGSAVTPLKYVVRKLTRPTKPEDEILICSNKGTVVPRGEKNPGLVSMTEAGYQGVVPGDLLIHGMDAWHGAIAVSDLPGKCTSVVHVCESDQDKRYIAYYLRMLSYRSVYKAFSNGVRQNTSDFRSWIKAGEIPIVLPPLENQIRIADYLDSACLDIDNAIGAAQSSIEEYGQYAKETVYRLVMGYELGDYKRVYTGVEWLGTIPEHWRLIPFRYLYREKSLSGYAQEQLLSVYLNKGVIRYEDSDGMQVHKPSESLEKYQLVVPGNLVLNNQQAWRGSVGVSEYRGIISPAYHIYEQTGNLLNNQYANLLFKGPWVPCFTVCSTGVGSIQRNISKQLIKTEKVPVPPLDEQLSIVEAALSIQRAVEEIIAQKQSIIDDLTHYKQSLVYEVVTGKREV